MSAWLGKALLSAACQIILYCLQLKLCLYSCLQFRYSEKVGRPFWCNILIFCILIFYLPQWRLLKLSLLSSYFLRPLSVFFSDLRLSFSCLGVHLSEGIGHSPSGFRSSLARCLGTHSSSSSGAWFCGSFSSASSSKLSIKHSTTWVRGHRLTRSEHISRSC